DNHLYLDGVEVPIARVKSAGDGGVVGGDPATGMPFDPTAGRLIVRGRHDEPEGGYVVSFRIPPGTPPGKRQVRFETCGVAAPETAVIDVLPSPAPVITAVSVV